MRYDVSSAEALAPVAGVLRTIDRVAVDLGATFLLIGAVARDLHLHFVADLPIQRATRDLDLAIRVESWHMYDDLLNRFGRPRLRHRVVIEGCDVDVLPFGPLEAPPGSISFEEGTHLSVLGLAEAMASADAFLLPGDLVVSVPCPAALAVLKLFAWVDRGYATDKDARDLGQILGVYAQPHWADHLYTSGMDHLRTHGFDVVPAAVALLGAEAVALMSRETMSTLRELDRERLTAALLPNWFEPGAGPADVAEAVGLFLGD